MMFKERKKKKRSKDEEPERDMTQEEQDLLKKFEEGDKEIDAMLEVVNEQLDRLKLHAEGLGTQIDNQKQLISKVNKKTEQSWQRLRQKDSALQSVLDTYRSQNKCCCDIVLILIIVALMGLVLNVFQQKGYL